MSEDDADNDVENRCGGSDNTVGPEDSPADESFEGIARGSLCDLQGKEVSFGSDILIKF